MSNKNWYVGHWPALAWLETIIKLIAIGIGVSAFIMTRSSGVFIWPDNPRLCQVFLLGFISAGWIGTIIDRVIERELVAMVFVFLNLMGHWGMLLALFSPLWPGTSLIAFSILMLTGDVVKLIFFKVHHFKVRDIPRWFMFALTGASVVVYALIIGCELGQAT